MDERVIDVGIGVVCVVIADGIGAGLGYLVDRPIAVVEPCCPLSLNVKRFERGQKQIEVEVEFPTRLNCAGPAVGTDRYRALNRERTPMKSSKSNTGIPVAVSIFFEASTLRRVSHAS